jgi:integrase
MHGHIRRRGIKSWEIKFDRGRDPMTGRRRTSFQSVKGTKRDAQAKLVELLAAEHKGAYVEPSKLTIAAFVAGRVDQWEAAGTITGRTADRYRQLVNNQIVPHLGAKPLQQLTRLDIETWHNALRSDGLAARTIGHAHRVLGKALSDAEGDGLVVRNVCRLRRPPKVAEKEMIIVRDVPGFVAILRATDSRMFVPAMIALCTGLRLAEVLALRWNRIDLDRKTVLVREALESTKAHGVKFKRPKSKAGRRDLTLPDILVGVLREYRARQAELHARLDAGAVPDDALLFAGLDGRPLNPGNASSDWGELAERIGMPEVTFHALRHTHASQLIAGGVDVVTVSKRLGHAKPSVTLAIYAHMFTTDDSKAAAAVNAALGVS